MHEIALFVEDYAHQQVIGALVQKVADQHGVNVQLVHGDEQDKQRPCGHSLVRIGEDCAECRHSVNRIQSDGSVLRRFRRYRPRDELIRPGRAGGAGSRPR